MGRTYQLPRGSGEPSQEAKIFKAAPASRTRSKTTTSPSKAVQSKDVKAIHAEPSVLPAQDSPLPQSRPRKRRLVSKTQLGEDAQYGGGSAVDLTPKKRKTATPKKANSDGEKRLRAFRRCPPQSYLLKLERATSQRMFVVNRTLNGTAEIPSETVEMAGTTGNIYAITITLEPHCTCPDNKKGNQCKHIVYVLHNVLKAPEHLQYQLAFLSSELREIFSHAPAPASAAVEEAADKGGPSNRKEIAGDCPICFMEFDRENEEIVWCKAACGNNIHKHCFEQWAKSQRRMADVNRTPWQGDEDSIAEIKTQGQMNSEGYVNIASQLGLSGRRDTSTYHQPWLRRQRTMGYDDYDDY
ncbi:MAG: hypothetical protein LQ344_006396 [Seirophora lacunosa]|nr:MAG: hypothetical protein LQ344_006396 [Seirophora lacunosa]